MTTVADGPHLPEHAASCMVYPRTFRTRCGKFLVYLRYHGHVGSKVHTEAPDARLWINSATFKMQGVLELLDQ